MHSSRDSNRFVTFYKEFHFIALKNSPYNYRLRKFAVSRYLNTQKPSLILEAGSGLSPVSNRAGQTVFSEISFDALAVLKRLQPEGSYVVADCCRLPFKPNIFSHTIASEVLEHLVDDNLAMAELARVTHPGGELVVTFPHRKAYYSSDDRYVGHYRRYDVDDMRGLMRAGGFGGNTWKKLWDRLKKLPCCWRYFYMRNSSLNQIAQTGLFQGGSAILSGYFSSLPIHSIWGRSGWRPDLCPCLWQRY